RGLQVRQWQSTAPLRVRPRNFITAWKGWRTRASLDLAAEADNVFEVVVDAGLEAGGERAVDDVKALQPADGAGVGTVFPLEHITIGINAIVELRERRAGDAVSLFKRL